jgi:hypothetical protein
MSLTDADLDEIRDLGLTFTTDVLANVLHDARSDRPARLAVAIPALIAEVRRLRALAPLK